MTTWIQDALKKLSIEEFERVLRKAEEVYGSGCMITGVNRSENKLQVTVQIATGGRKLIVL